MNTRNVTLFAASIALLAGVLLLLTSRQKHPTDNGPPTVRVGVLKHESSLPFYIAAENGLFTKEGLKVELIELPPGDHLPALLSNRVDVISPTSFTALFGVMSQNNDELYALFPGAEIAGGPTVYGFAVQATSSAQTVKDLASGTVLAINPFTKVNVEMIFEASSVQRSEAVKVVTREAALAAVESGQAVAAILDQPALANAAASGRFRIIEANPRAKYVGSPYWSGAGAVRRTVWNKNATEIHRLMNAIDNATLAIRADEKAAHRILAKKLGLDSKVADQMGGYYFPLQNENVERSGIQRTVDALKKAGILQGDVDVSSLFPPGSYPP